MGSVKLDIHKGGRLLDDTFPIDTEAGVFALLENIHHVREHRFSRGDYAASLLLIDFGRALEESPLTAKQREVLRMLYEDDLTQQVVGKRLGITQQAVLDRLNNAVRNIVNTIKQKEDADRE